MSNFLSLELLALLTSGVTENLSDLGDTRAFRKPIRQFAAAATTTTITTTITATITTTTTTTTTFILINK